MRRWTGPSLIGSDNGLSPVRCQAIIWTNAGILLIGPLGTNFSEILIGIQTISFKKMHLKMSSAKWRPFCLGLNVLTITITILPLYVLMACLLQDLHFRALFVDVEYNEACGYDALTLASYNSDLQMILCGDHCLPEIVLSHHKVVVRFTSDYSVRGFGFELDYASVVAGRYFTCWIVSWAPFGPGPHLGLVSHICVVKNSSHFPSDAYMRRKSLYFSYSPRGRPKKQCQAKMTF